MEEQKEAGGDRENVRATLKLTGIRANPESVLCQRIHVSSRNDRCVFITRTAEGSHRLTHILDSQMDAVVVNRHSSITRFQCC